MPSEQALIRRGLFDRALLGAAPWRRGVSGGAGIGRGSGCRSRAGLADATPGSGGGGGAGDGYGEGTAGRLAWRPDLMNLASLSPAGSLPTSGRDSSFPEPELPRAQSPSHEPVTN
jgi:hypothetical protein